MISPSRMSGVVQNKSFGIGKILICLTVLSLGVWGVWLAVIPESLLARYVESSLHDRGIDIEIAGLKKGLFFTVQMERIMVSPSSERLALTVNEENGPEQAASSVNGNRGNSSTLLTIEHMRVTPDPLSFFQFSPRFHFTGSVGGGAISGIVSLEQPGTALEMQAADVRIDGLAVLERFGIRGKGTLSCRLDWKVEKGSLLFSIKQARLTGSLPGLIALPMEVFHSVKGWITIGNMVAVPSLTLEGKGLYARIRGHVRENAFHGQAEFMLDASSDHYDILQAVMSRYRRSPGHYVVTDLQVAMPTFPMP